MIRILLSALACLFGAVSLNAAERPNIVWLLSEDNSKHYLDLFDEAGAPTPNIAQLAENGLLFEHAFSNSPVCSVARTTLQTGCYGPRIGTHFHRKSKLAEMPEGLKMFPTFLAEAGYYTTNNSKKDYNAVEPKNNWHESSRKANWRNRPEAKQPFFHMESLGTSHESSLHFKTTVMEKEQTKTDRSSVTISPYYPDTPIFRYTYARYQDKIMAVDEWVGKTVEKLKEDGVLEDTFIFYFGDHGGVLPGSKGYVRETGLHVPLVVRIPENWKHLVDGARGSRVSGFVSFIDFGPTTLKLAGLEVPEQMDGRPFLGDGVKMADVNGRNETFGYADRFDEKYEFIRTLRKGKFKYFRNYQGYYPDGLQNNYRYRMLAFEEWREIWKAGGLNPVQSRFFESKPAEELYDLEADPHETKNLAADPALAETLIDLRTRLSSHVKALPDLSLYPESVLFDEAMDNPVAFGQAHKAEIEDLVDIADLALLPFDEARPKLEAALKSDNPNVRQWALTDCAVFGKAAESLAEAAKPLLDDEQLLVRTRAAEFLGSIHAADPVPTLLDVLAKSESHVETLIVMNAVVFLRDFHGYKFEIDLKAVKSQGGEVKRRTDYLTGKLN
ncbi:MAG: arylsulfatase A-like enzyme [Verrucomicrobiales bacterium]|jgi:arylsulfatase A-like enzyme